MSTGKVNLSIIEPGATYRELIEWVSTIPLVSLKYDIATSRVIGITSKPHNLSTGNLINIREVLPFEYNINGVSITVINPYSFSYTPISPPTVTARLINAYSLQIPINLTGCTASLKIYSQATGLSLIDLTTSNGGLSMTAANGILNAYISDENTLALPTSTKALPHRYTLEVFHPNGDVTLLAKGFLSAQCNAKGLVSSLFSTGNDDMIVLAAPQGAPGVSGTSGDDNIMSFSFSWGDVSPNLLFNIPSGDSVLKVEVAVLTAFDAASSLSVGDIGDNQRLFPQSSIDLGAVGTYNSNIAYTYTSPTNINLYLNLGVGNTQGNGLVFVYVT